MTTTYADNYEEITGKKRGTDEAVEAAVVDATPAVEEEAVIETKVIDADSDNVDTK